MIITTREGDLELEVNGTGNDYRLTGWRQKRKNIVAFFVHNFLQGWVQGSFTTLHKGIEKLSLLL
jgi:hypothetical protein